MTAIHFLGSVPKLGQEAAFLQISDDFHHSTAKMPQAREDTHWTQPPKSYI